MKLQLWSYELIKNGEIVFSGTTAALGMSSAILNVEKLLNDNLQYDVEPTNFKLLER